MGVLGSNRVAFVFPGQGSQNVGMGKSLAENYPVAAEIFAKADSALGFSVSELCFEGPEEALSQTINTQPALYTVSAAAFEVAREHGVWPVFVAGHSVGEYAALYAAGVFSFEDELKLVRKRAELMNAAAQEHPGSMAAVLGMEEDQVKALVQAAGAAGVICAANFNSPVQTVISGETAAIEKAGELAKEMGAKRFIVLNVSGAFHSPLMSGAAAELKKALVDVHMEDPATPIIANYTGRFEPNVEEIRTNLARQITGSVLWTESVRRMAVEGAEVFVELGPGKVLSGLISKINPDVEVYSAGDKESMEALLA